MSTGEHQRAKQKLVPISLRSLQVPHDLTLIFDPRHHDEKAMNAFRTFAGSFQK
jgi:hypothetical protein